MDETKYVDIFINIYPKGNPIPMISVFREVRLNTIEFKLLHKNELIIRGWQYGEIVPSEYHILIPLHARFTINID